MRRWVPAVLAVAVALACGDVMPAASAGPAGAPARSGAWIGEVKKVHNVDVGGGAFAVQLTAPVETWGMKGRRLAMVVFFHDATGNPIPSNLPGCAGDAGQIRLVSPDVSVSSDREGTDFQFRVPYSAFPRRATGRYEVEGRIRLIERTAAGRDLVATGNVRFWVEG